MRKLIAILVVVTSSAYGGAFAPAIDLSTDQHRALAEAAKDVTPHDVGIRSIYASRDHNKEKLVAHVESGPYEINGYQFRADWLACYEESNELWMCRKTQTMEYVFSGITEQSVWLQDDIPAHIASAILTDAISRCELSFDGYIIGRPQLAWARNGYYRFWAPKCRYEYEYIEGQAIVGKPHQGDTPQIVFREACDLIRLTQYMETISSVLHSNWKVPFAEDQIMCLVEISQASDGRIVDYRFNQCEYGTTVQRSIEHAIEDTAYLPLDGEGHCSFETVRLAFSHPTSAVE